MEANEPAILDFIRGSLNVLIRTKRKIKPLDILTIMQNAELIYGYDFPEFKTYEMPTGMVDAKVEAVYRTVIGIANPTKNP